MSKDQCLRGRGRLFWVWWVMAPGWPLSKGQVAQVKSEQRAQEVDAAKAARDGCGFVDRSLRRSTARHRF